MKPKRPEIVATITEDFKLEYSVPKMLELHLRTIGAGEKVRSDIIKYRKKRTKPQNAYLWSTVYPTIIAYIMEQTGQKFGAEDLHEKYKKKYLGYEKCKLMPDLIKVRSSTDLDMDEFWEQLIEHICREWADLGLFIPLPKKKEE